jgi:predicted permease
MREWIARLLDWMRKDALDRELQEEMRFHRQQLERDAMAEGATADQSRSIASRRFGNATVARESARERWTIPTLDQVQQDVRYAFRGLRRSPGFTATVVLTLGLGIGANVAMFDVVDRLMFRPLAHLRTPAATHRIYWQRLERGKLVTTMSSPYTRYLDLRRWTTSFSDLAAFSERDLAIGEGEASRDRRVGAVSASYFAFFDARPALGRFFTEEEDATPRGAEVVVLSHPFWQTEFGGRDVRGEVLRIGNIRATIIGVAPEGFAGVNDAYPPVAYVPITTYAASTGTNDAKTYFSTYQWGWVNTLVRRKADVTIEQATADATHAFQRSWAVAQVQEPQTPSLESVAPRVVVASVRPAGGPDRSLEARTALWVTAVAAIVLLIACANVANLALARALRRQRETAVRLALGVSRRRLIMESLTESIVLAVIGGVAALVVAQWAGATIRGMLVTASAPLVVFSDRRTIGITLALSLAVGVVVGLVAAPFWGRVDLVRSLRGGARGGVSDGTRLRTTLLVAQAALSVVLLVGAALFVRSLGAVQGMRMGYDAENVLLVNRVIRGAFPADSEHLAMRRLLLSTAQAMPEVESAAWVSSAPFVSTSSSALFVQGIDSVGRLGVFTYQATTPDYFRAMGTRILRGRGFTDADRLGAPLVAVVSESMAKILWPDRDALGQCFRMRADTMPCLTVVGIAEDMIQRDITGGERFHYYMPIEQFTRTFGNGMVLRLRGDPAVEGERIRARLQSVMTGASYLTTQPLEDIVHTAQRAWRMGATMFVAFGMLALVVAAVGLYGVIGYNVAQRMHELGVRVALGAQDRDIIGLVVGQSVRLTILAIALGSGVALLAGRWIQPLLFRQSATDPVVYTGVGVTMLIVALAASALPAIRASRADPNSALRSE